jgi:thiol-disulfide isomerase/thioredoxin
MKMPISTWLIVLSSILLSSCQPNNQTPAISKNGSWINENPPVSTELIDPYIVRLDEVLLQSLVTLDLPFLVYAGNPSCSSCQAFKPVITAWIRETRAMVYYLDTLQLLFALPNLTQNYPSLFGEGFSTPTLYLIQGQQRLLFARSQQVFYQLSRFRPWIQSFLSVKNNYIFHADKQVPFNQKTLFILINWQSIPDVFQDWLTTIENKDMQFLVFSYAYTQMMTNLSTLLSQEVSNTAQLIWLNNTAVTLSIDSILTSQELLLWLNENVI